MTRRALALGTAVLALAACGQTGRSSAPHAAPVAPADQLVQVSTGKARTVALGSLSASQLADAQRAFGADLIRKVCTKEHTGNATVSPASAALALGLLDAGARGDSEKRISELLHLPRWSDDVVAAYQAQRLALAKVPEVQVSNHLYSLVGQPPTTQTLDDVATAFAAELAQLDFAGHPKEATDHINADVNKDTKGLIPKLFDDALGDDTVTVLTNAIHLKAKWQAPFETSRSSPFTTDDGTKVDVSMMSGEVFGTLRADDGWQSVELPYVGGNLSAVAILPPAGADCSAITGARLTKLVRGEHSQVAGLEMPQVDLKQKHELKDVLAALGLPLDGDMSGLGAHDDEISEVVQKVTLKVDEGGTEAAAATGIGVRATSLIATQVNLVLDRPYLLVIQDTATGTPLFLSRVGNPKT
jgi:serpin B